MPEPEASAEVLLSELLGIGRAELALYERPLTVEQASLYEAWISRRLEREPVQRILGYAYFRNLVLDLNEDTLIPRPDTESVVDLALELIDLRGYPCRVLDVGTGSGAIAISIAQERPRCEVHATEVSETALRAARANADRNDTEVRFHHADVVSGLGFLEGRIDLLVSNPPYVDETSAAHRLAPEVREWDPPVALYSGTDELGFFRRIFAETPSLAEGWRRRRSGDRRRAGREGAESRRERGFSPLCRARGSGGHAAGRAVEVGAVLRAVSPEKAAEALRSGKVALVPTETVVGLVCCGVGLITGA